VADGDDLAVAGPVGDGEAAFDPGGGVVVGAPDEVERDGCCRFLAAGLL